MKVYEKVISFSQSPIILRGSLKKVFGVGQLQKGVSCHGELMGFQVGPNLLFRVSNRKVTDRAPELHRTAGVGDIGVVLLKMVSKIGGSKIGGTIKLGRAVFLRTDQRVFFKPGMVMARWPADALHNVVDPSGKIIYRMQHSK